MSADVVQLAEMVSIGGKLSTPLLTMSNRVSGTWLFLLSASLIDFLSCIFSIHEHPGRRSKTTTNGKSMSD